MYMCMYTYTYGDVSDKGVTSKHPGATSKHACMHACMNACMHACRQASRQACMHACMRLSSLIIQNFGRRGQTRSLCVYKYICIYIYMYICISVEWSGGQRMTDGQQADGGQTTAEHAAHLLLGDIAAPVLIYQISGRLNQA